MAKIEDIEIYTGPPEFDFTPIRALEVKCEATNALMPAPTIDEANGRLRALAAKVGANAIVNVEYNSGISFTSWKSLKATGMAGTKASDEVQCDVCAETIKRAAIKCRYCGADRSHSAEEIARIEVEAEAAPVATPPPPAAGAMEPLRDNNNPAIVIGLVAVGIFILFMIMGSVG